MSRVACIGLGTMGGPMAANTAVALMTPGLSTPENTFGLLKDLLSGLEDRLDSVRSNVNKRNQLAAATPSIWPTHGWLLLYGLTSQSIGYLLISLSLPRLPAVLTSIILLTQPVTTVLLARVLLDETPSVAQLAGVVLIVGGIAFATLPFAKLRERAAESPGDARDDDDHDRSAISGPAS